MSNQAVQYALQDGVATIVILTGRDGAFSAGFDLKVMKRGGMEAIGMLKPRVAAAMLRHRLQPAAYQRAVTVSEFFDVNSARDAGFFDEVVEANMLATRAAELAEQFKQLDATAHRVSKRRIRKATIRRIRRGRWLDLLDAALVGLKR